ncbi:hypothetical protein ACH5RR_031778, partial [Cinchona calisaya]
MEDKTCGKSCERGINTWTFSSHATPPNHNCLRDRDRERAQARNVGKGKGKDDGLTPEQRRERDAKALQEKAAKKEAQAASGAMMLE